MTKCNKLPRDEICPPEFPPSYSSSAAYSWSAATPHWSDSTANAAATAAAKKKGLKKKQL
jgi:hypothetical protein